jgi:hypothetical protein
LPRQSPLKHEETFSTAMSSKINKLLPSVKIARQVPSDEEAIRLKSLWKQPKKELFTIILHDKEMGPCLDFLHNVSKAVSERLCPSLVIDASQWNESGVWSSLFEKHNPSLIVASKQLLSRASLSVFLREDTTHNLFYLKEIPLIVLDPIQTYLTHPLAKKALWNTLCHHLKT